jgi:hypothetical protein
MATTEAERAATTDRLAAEMPVELTADQQVDQQVAAAAEHAQAWLPSVAALREHGIAAVSFTSAATAAEPRSPPSWAAVDVNTSTGADEDENIEANEEMNGQMHLEELGVEAHRASSAGKPSAREGRDQVVATAKAAAMTAAMTALVEAEHAQAQWQARPAPPRHMSKGRSGTKIKGDAKDAKGAAAARVERVTAPTTAVAVAAMHSTALLGNKLQRTREATFDAATATATARGSRALATAVATEVAGSTATHYTGLANVDVPVVEEVARKVGKQLDPKWVSANAAATPVLGDLWNVLERQPQSCTVGALPPPNPMLMGHVLDTDWM